MKNGKLTIGRRVSLHAITLAALLTTLLSGCAGPRPAAPGPLAGTLDAAFQTATAAADRIVVLYTGFDCCNPLDGEYEIMFETTDAREIAELRAQLRFKNLDFDELPFCMCCGWPRMDWYKDGELIAHTAFQHGIALRWRGFSPTGTQYADAPLTDDSKQWFADWFSKHGVELGGIPDFERMRNANPGVETKVKRTIWDAGSPNESEENHDFTDPWGF